MAKALVKRAIENFSGRRGVNIPDETSDAIAGFSHEYVNYMLGGSFRASYWPLNSNIIDGRIRGVAGVVGCNNACVIQDSVHVPLIEELIANDVLVVQTGCSAIAAAKAGVDSIEHGSMLNDEGIRLMKEKGTYLVPTSYLFELTDYEGLPEETVVRFEYVKKFARESHRRAVAAGVKIAFGTDACVFPHGKNAKEFAVLVELGMSPLEAIQAATLSAIDLLGVDDR